MNVTIIKFVLSALFIIFGRFLCFSETPPVVDSYYTSIKGLETTNANKAFDLQECIMHCFAGKTKDDKSSGFSGINIYDNLTNNKNNSLNNDTIPSNLFAQRLKRAIHEQKNLKLVAYTPVSSTYSMQPMLNGKGEDQLCQTKVEVTYLKDNINRIPRTEYLGIVDNKIVKITNDEFNIDAVSLTIEAAKLYTQKKYKEAYEMYKKVLTIDPTDINALYRLGIMTVRGQGTKKNVSVAKSYLDRVIHLSSKDYKGSWWDLWNLKTKAEEAYYYVTHLPAI